MADLGPPFDFVIELTRLLEEHGYEISSSYDIDLHQNGRLVGFWPSTINKANFMEIK